MAMRDDNTDSSKTGPGPSRESRMVEVPRSLTSPTTLTEDAERNGGMSALAGPDPSTAD